MSASETAGTATVVVHGSLDSPECGSGPVERQEAGADLGMAEGAQAMVQFAQACPGAGGSPIRRPVGAEASSPDTSERRRTRASRKAGKARNTGDSSISRRLFTEDSANLQAEPEWLVEAALLVAGDGRTGGAPAWPATTASSRPTSLSPGVVQAASADAAEAVGGGPCGAWTR